MSGSLLDTSFVIHILQGDASAVEIYKSMDEAFVATIVVGELLYGVNKSDRRMQEANRKEINEAIETLSVLGVNEDIAQIYADIKHSLLKTGYTLPENDIWIAAIAKQNNLSVATYDAHFEYIEGIKIIHIDNV
jgi:predicted nucleic acid-binding protein